MPEIWACNLQLVLVYWHVIPSSIFPSPFNWQHSYANSSSNYPWYFRVCVCRSNFLSCEIQPPTCDTMTETVIISSVGWCFITCSKLSLDQQILHLNKAASVWVGNTGGFKKARLLPSSNICLLWLHEASKSKSIKDSWEGSLSLGKK